MTFDVKDLYTNIVRSVLEMDLLLALHTHHGEEPAFVQFIGDLFKRVAKHQYVGACVSFVPCIKVPPH